MDDPGPVVDDASSRVAPLPEPWDEADATAIGRWGHPSATYPPLLLTRVLQRHPGLSDRVRHLGEGIYVDGRLDPRVRTIAILRTCARIGSTYEWGGQAAFWGPLTGVSPEEADAVTRDAADADTWSEVDRAVLDAVDELEDEGSLSDDRWTALRAHLDDEQVLELLVVHGWYRMIASICNALGLDEEAWMRPWPAGPPA
jgi:alkylhydroperoxidase family enzyme